MSTSSGSECGVAWVKDRWLEALIRALWEDALQAMDNDPALRLKWPTMSDADRVRYGLEMHAETLNKFHDRCQDELAALFEDPAPTKDAA